MVIEVNQRRARLILSARNARWRRRTDLLEELLPGDVRTGTVSGLVDFGAFVDLGGLDGLIHVTELDWVHVGHPSEVLSVGDRVDVYVVAVDRDRERISLSRKRLLPDPWDRVVGPLVPGSVVEGVVATVMPYGAFVDIGEGIEGLAHVSEMPDGDATRDSLVEGARVSVRVLSTDRRRRRIALRIEPTADAFPVRPYTWAFAASETQA
jgi:small subunit ribosomal protein S1